MNTWEWIYATVAGGALLAIFIITIAISTPQGRRDDT